jgi:hypothetical protein
VIDADDIRPCTPLLPPEPTLADRALLDAWCDDLLDEAREAVDREATPDAFADDGTLHYGRLPGDDVDAFNPWIIARAPVAPVQVLPAPVTSVYPGALVRVRSWVTP